MYNMHFSEHYNRRIPVWRMDRSITKRLRDMAVDVEMLEADNAIMRSQLRALKDAVAELETRLGEIENECVEIPLK